MANPHFILFISSDGSLKASFESEIRSLHIKVSELTERVQQLEEDRSSHNVLTLSTDALKPSIEATPLLLCHSYLKRRKKKSKSST